MGENMKYLLIGDPKGRQMANKGTNVDDIELSGLYLWQKAFSEYDGGGVIDTLWRGEDLEDYDVGKIIDAQHKPIIDLKTFKEVKRILKLKRKK